MKKIGFIGAFEKADLIINLAKVIRSANKKVLVVDATILGKTKYIVPKISPSKFYITEFERVDFAIGFNSIEEIQNYLGTDELQYDLILIDVDSPEKFQSFELKNADRKYFVTAFDNYSLKRGLEIISGSDKKIQMTKIMFSRDMLKEEEDYLNFLAVKAPVQWDKEKIYFPYEQGDGVAIMENQRTAKITFRNLSSEYKYGLEMLTNQIIPEVKSMDIRKIIKTT